ncbi:MAG: hypothetical protein E7620_04025 [Ruminococcaceae bacterium]|nr:hypothetical protein [Oscillospiraceae bacterium]
MRKLLLYLLILCMLFSFVSCGKKISTDGYTEFDTLESFLSYVEEDQFESVWIPKAISDAFQLNKIILYDNDYRFLFDVYESDAQESRDRISIAIPIEKKSYQELLQSLEHPNAPQYELMDHGAFYLPQSNLWYYDIGDQFIFVLPRRSNKHFEWNETIVLNEYFSFELREFENDKRQDLPWGIYVSIAAAVITVSAGILILRGRGRCRAKNN